MTENLPTKRPDESGILLYQTEDGRARIEVRTDRETVWLSLNQMADLFQRDKSVISRQMRIRLAQKSSRPGSAKVVTRLRLS